MSGHLNHQNTSALFLIFSTQFLWKKWLMNNRNTANFATESCQPVCQERFACSVKSTERFHRWGKRDTYLHNSACHTLVVIITSAGRYPFLPNSYLRAVTSRIPFPATSCWQWIPPRPWDWRPPAPIILWGRNLRVVA